MLFALSLTRVRNVALDLPRHTTNMLIAEPCDTTEPYRDLLLSWQCGLVIHTEMENLPAQSDNHNVFEGGIQKLVLLARFVRHKMIAPPHKHWTVTPLTSTIF